MERCRSLGLEPVLGESARNRFGYLAGTDEQRAKDLQIALDDDSIAGVWALRGGYGTVRLLDYLDFSRVGEKPKAYIGFSDNTTLHLALFNAGIVSFHGPHPGADFPHETREAFERVLFHDQPAGDLPLRDVDPAPRTIRSGVASGPLIGGNMSILGAACGTRQAMNARGCIVFIEDLGEPAYRIDRTFVQLLRSGVLEGAVGLAFGRFTDVEVSDSDRPVDDLLLELADKLGVPAACDFPVGHIEHNWTLPLGVKAELNANHARLTILEAAVTES